MPSSRRFAHEGNCGYVRPRWVSGILASISVLKLFLILLVLGLDYPANTPVFYLQRSSRGNPWEGKPAISTT